jgi:hypothetical protein
MSRSNSQLNEVRQSNKSTVHYFMTMRDYPCGTARTPGMGDSTIILDEVTCRKCLDYLHERLMGQARRVLIRMGNIA